MALANTVQTNCPGAAESARANGFRARDVYQVIRALKPSGEGAFRYLPINVSGNHVAAIEIDQLPDTLDFHIWLETV